MYLVMLPMPHTSLQAYTIHSWKRNMFLKVAVEERRAAPCNPLLQAVERLLQLHSILNCCLRRFKGLLATALASNLLIVVVQSLKLPLHPTGVEAVVMGFLGATLNLLR